MHAVHDYKSATYSTATVQCTTKTSYNQKDITCSTSFFVIKIHNTAANKFSVFGFFLQHLQPVTISLKFSDTQESLTIADVSVCLGSLRKVHFNFVSIHILTLHSSPCSERNVFRCLIRTHSELVSDWLKVIRYLKKIEVISLGKCV